MNRRDILKFGGAAIFTTVGSCVAVRGRAVAGSAFAPISSERQRILNEMILQSGGMWERYRDRQKSPVLVYFGDGPAAELRQDGSRKWQINYRELTKSEADQLDQYYQEVSPHMGTRLGDRFHRDSDYRIRAWVLNGRQPEWNCSIDYKGPVT